MLVICWPYKPTLLHPTIEQIHIGRGEPTSELVVLNSKEELPYPQMVGRQLRGSKLSDEDEVSSHVKWGKTRVGLQMAKNTKVECSPLNPFYHFPFLVSVSLFCPTEMFWPEFLLLLLLLLVAFGLSRGLIMQVVTKVVMQVLTQVLTGVFTGGHRW